MPAQPHHLQQHESGHYEVVPPLPSAQNGGRSGHNPYDFIMNPNAVPNKSVGPLGGSTFLMRIALLIGGLVVLFIIAGVLITKLSPKGSTPGMISIAERQQEIIRVSTAAAQQATSTDAKNFVANVELSVTSSQQQILSYLSLNGTKVNGKTLALDQSSATDTQLANAATANNYDSAVTQNLIAQLEEYESLLQNTYKQSTGQHAKTLLQNNFTGAELLLRQAKALSTEL
jgi:hypothetical protein